MLSMMIITNYGSRMDFVSSIRDGFFTTRDNLLRICDSLLKISLITYYKSVMVY